MCPKMNPWVGKAMTAEIAAKRMSQETLFGIGVDHV